jgi:hypothetical protein
MISLKQARKMQSKQKNLMNKYEKLMNKATDKKKWHGYAKKRGDAISRYNTYGETIRYWERHGGK